MNNASNSAKDKLITDLKSVLADAEELLKLTADQAGEKLSGVRSRLDTGLEKMKEQIGETESLMAAKTKEAAQATEEYVREHPMKSVGIVAGVAFVFGLLIGRR